MWPTTFCINGGIIWMIFRNLRMTSSFELVINWQPVKCELCRDGVKSKICFGIRWFLLWISSVIVILYSGILMLYSGISLFSLCVWENLWCTPSYHQSTVWWYSYSCYLKYPEKIWKTRKNKKKHFLNPKIGKRKSFQRRNVYNCNKNLILKKAPPQLTQNIFYT